QRVLQCDNLARWEVSRRKGTLLCGEGRGRSPPRTKRPPLMLQAGGLTAGAKRCDCSKQSLQFRDSASFPLAPVSLGAGFFCPMADLTVAPFRCLLPGLERTQSKPWPKRSANDPKQTVTVRAARRDRNAELLRSAMRVHIIVASLAFLIVGEA